jgi:exodeoxyribonuclease III
MRVVTWNVNGLRAAWGRGLGKQLRALAPDVVMLQEIRCTPDVLPDDFRLPRGFRATWHPAAKKGWSGVATWTRGPHVKVSVGTLGDADPDGRVLVTDFDGVRLVNVYAPSGSSGEAAQARKDRFMVDFLPFARGLAAHDGPVVVAGDLNVAPEPIDVWEPKRSAKLSGCLPHERRWIADVLGLGFVDVVRHRGTRTPGPWTWWSNFGTAKAEDRGWRIDLALVNQSGAKHVTSATVDRDAGLACSDHAPVIVDLAFR